MNCLFLCRTNAILSQLAEGWARHFISPRFHIYSAGTHPEPRSALALRAMQEVGIDITAYQSKPLDAVPLAAIHYAVVLEPGVCVPRWEAGTRCFHWWLPNMPERTLAEQSQMEAIRDIRDELEIRTKSFSVYLQGVLENPFRNV